MRWPERTNANDAPLNMVSRRTQWLLIALAASLGVLVAYSYYSPHLHIDRLRSAAEARDTDRLRELVDFESVRASLKDDIRTMFVQRMSRDLAGNPFAGLGMLMVNAMVDPMVDMIVSPQSIIAIVDRGKVEADISAKGKVSRAPDEPAPTTRRREAIIEQGYENYRRYVITVRPADEPQASLSLYLRRDGLFSWKVYKISLPQTLFSR